MNAEDVIGILAIVNTLLVGLVGWLTRQQVALRIQVTKIATGMAVIQQDLRPRGGRPLADRITDAERAVAVLAASRSNP